MKAGIYLFFSDSGNGSILDTSRPPPEKPDLNKTVTPKYVPKPTSTYIPTTSRRTNYPSIKSSAPLISEKEGKKSGLAAAYVPTHVGVIVEDTDKMQLTTVRDDKQRMRTKYNMGISVARKGTEGIMSVIIPSKTLLEPTPTKVKRYGTSVDNQQIVTIEVT